MGHSARRELLAKGLDATFLREMIGFAAQRLMELETESLTGAVRGERSSDRQVQRNGYRKRDLHTRAGTVELRIPRLRKGPLAFSTVSPAGKRGRDGTVEEVREGRVVTAAEQQPGLYHGRAGGLRGAAGLQERCEHDGSPRQARQAERILSMVIGRLRIRLPVA